MSEWVGFVVVVAMVLVLLAMTVRLGNLPPEAQVQVPQRRVMDDVDTQRALQRAEDAGYGVFPASPAQAAAWLALHEDTAPDGSHERAELGMEHEVAWRNICAHYADEPQADRSGQ